MSLQQNQRLQRCFQIAASFAVESTGRGRREGRSSNRCRVIQWRRACRSQECKLFHNKQTELNHLLPSRSREPLQIWACNSKETAIWSAMSKERKESAQQQGRQKALEQSSADNLAAYEINEAQQFATTHRLRNVQ